uniref:Uncharacterized protein n=1 Tax=Amphiprion ocellaris TaxID=80972 RepID=A0AAQ5YIJ5_AMPOC
MKQYTLNVQFTAEKQTGRYGVQHVWHECGLDHHSECMVLTVQHRSRSVMIWGCMSGKCVGEMAFMIEDTMNSSGYTKILSDSMQKLVKMMTWLGMLPDLNATEDFCSILKRKVEQHNPSSKEQLKIVSEEWQNISLAEED